VGDDVKSDGVAPPGFSLETTKKRPPHLLGQPVLLCN
jgi:hypothetical protein